MTFTLPSKSQVGYLDPEIAGEGQRVIYSDGDTTTWTPPAPQPVMPDFSKIKTLARYFGRIGFQTWPAWLYHPAEEPRLIKNQDEATSLGICYRKATADEAARYGNKDVWDWEDGCKWRPTPFPKDIKFDAKKLGHGKTLVAGQPNQAHAQNELIRQLVPDVAAAVAQALKVSAPAAPAHVEPADWEAFQQFLAWKKSAEAVEEVAIEAEAQSDTQSNALTADQEKMLWEEEAKRLGIKVDGRWSVERLKAEVEKVS